MMDELQGLLPTLPRRGVVMTGLIAGFTLATTRVDAQAITTDSQGLVAGATQIPAGDGAMLPAYVAKPTGAGPFPVVLVIEEIFGVHEYIKDICRRLAKEGYLAVAPELYARIADLSTMTDAGAIVRDVISKAPDALMLSDLDSAASWAFANGGDSGRLAITGFCRGGRGAWMYDAHTPKVRAAVAWYGPVGGQTSTIQPSTAADAAPQLNAPLLGLYGGKDTGIPPDSVQAAAAKARDAGKKVEIVIYPDAGHGFHADYRPSYNKEAAEDGWKRMLAWFRANGV
jgi:carboxymethylenebutenolidase